MPYLEPSFSCLYFTREWRCVKDYFATFVYNPQYVVSTRRYPVSLPRPLADGRTTMTIPDYPALAVAAGDPIHVQVIDDAEHLRFLLPEEESYAATILAIKRLLKMR